MWQLKKKEEISTQMQNLVKTLTTSSDCQVFTDQPSIILGLNRLWSDAWGNFAQQGGPS